MSLNDQQSAIVEASALGVVIAEALAGTGKSHTLKFRAIRLLLQNSLKLILITFNKRIQLEMEAKFKSERSMWSTDSDGRLISQSRAHIKTSHSFALSMVRDYLHLLPMIKAPKIDILEAPFKVEDLAEELVKKERLAVSRKELRVVTKTLINIGDLARSCDKDTFLQLLNRMGKELKLLSDVGLADPMPLAKAIYEDRYTRGLLAFSDMLPLAVKLPDHCYQNLGYEYAMVDEAQDLNLVQHQLVEKLRNATKGLTLVGDSYQAIYGFTGAMPHMFQSAARRYNGTVYPLEINYRCSPKIIAFANTILRDFLDSHLRLQAGRTDLDEYPDPWILPGNQSIAQWSNQMLDQMIPLKQQAVLYRLNKQALRLELELINAKIPYQAKTGGFMQLPVVKDILSYFMLFLQDQESVWWETIISHRKYLGKDTATASWGQAMWLDDKRPWMTEPDTLRNGGQKQAWSELRSFLDLLSRGIRSGRIKDILQMVWNQLNDYWREKYASDPTGYEDVLEIASATREWLESISGTDELKEVFLDRKRLTSEEGINLLTIHKAKGLEWDAGLLYNVGPTTFVRDWQSGDAEEYRLAYVACTRFRKYLAISCDQRVNDAFPVADGGILGRHARKVLYGPHGWPQTIAEDEKHVPC